MLMLLVIGLFIYFFSLSVMGRMITQKMAGVLGKAIAHAINQKPYMENYLKNGRYAISYNVAENAIRPFTIGCKNWLFCDTAKDADASVIIYSIVETARLTTLMYATIWNTYSWLCRLKTREMIRIYSTI